jgi:kumamolisin
MSDSHEIAEKTAEKVDSQPGLLQQEATEAFGPRISIIQDRAVLLDSRTTAPAGSKVGPTDAGQEISSTIIVRSKASRQELDETLKQVVNHERKPLSDAEFNERFGADPQSMSRVVKFAEDNGLKVVEADARSGKVSLKGSVGDFNKAFQVKLEDYKLASGETSRERSGAISVPRELARDVQGVFGLESRTCAHPMFVKQPKDGPFSTRASSGYLPSQVADAYNFPKESMGAGQNVGIIELGGGLDFKDNADYYKKYGLKVPEIQTVGMDGVVNSPGGSADSEVALDSQIIGVVAPEAHQQIVFSAPTEQGFLDAIMRATYPQEGEKQNSVISISWGGRESSWSQQAISNMDEAFKKAALKGITVFAAAGDAGAGDLNPGQSDDGKFVVDFPATDPWVIGTGGTKLTLDAHGRLNEITWNESKISATGGGISQIFTVPDFQKDVKMPADANKPPGKAGRGVPDVAGNADPYTGYKVRVGGDDQVIGGTSAVAPLYSALTLRLNGALGHPVGYLNPILYKNGTGKVFHDISSGNNNGYNAGPGWDATTGWGTIEGAELLKALRKSGS